MTVINRRPAHVSFICATLIGSMPHAKAAEPPPFSVAEITVLVEVGCPATPEKGSSSSNEIDGAIRAAVSKYVKRIADIKIEGAGKHQSNEYEGLLQRDLLAARKDMLTCRETIIQSALKYIPRTGQVDSVAPKPKLTATKTALKDSSNTIIGTWKESVRLKWEREWKEIGTYEVARNQTGYIISAREQREPPNFMPSIGIFGVEFDGTTWKFNSNWGGGYVGNFDLRRKSPTVFEGAVKLEGQPIGETKWVRVQ